VTFDYTTRDGTAGPRRVEPQHLITSGGLWYLLAHDTHKNDWRIYRIDRIGRPSPTGQRVPRRSLPGGNIEVERVVSKDGQVHLAGRYVIAAEILGGRRVGIRIEQTTLMFFDPANRQLLRTRPSPLTWYQA
jgi:predicted DNA-binding transcriptional regulator YafY